MEREMERERFMAEWRRRQGAQAEAARLEAAREYIARLDGELGALRSRLLRGWSAPRAGAE